MSDMTIRRPVKWSSAAETDIGKVRQINEDAVIARPDVGLWAVADGMGGYEAGNVASGMIVKSLEGLSFNEHLNDAVDSIEDCIIDVNQRILEYAEIMLEGRTFGSTVVSFLIKGQVGICLWAGDSRLYRYRNQKLELLSRDHSRVEELLQRGLLTPEESKEHPESNVITRAVGMNGDFCLDMTAFRVQIGDTFLLCSDGLYNAVDDDEIVANLTPFAPEEAVERLIACALDNGGPDNVSVIVIKGSQHTVDQ